ncbi:alginate O-acetyltransferase complex protein AlgI [Lysobacter niastensis]|uniref:Probable alginate O-acetylase n=1 Tax=Lysobacter niastensis TaxID=380629 RepID=A0ABU1WDD5_9GAMM|nr:MBOAT family O-acyltransferase [Lysobacter niastensis]MDR7135370.1 alginate O-acetyltransferase complex protein AlgI [Lysobacter niastensis]
MVFNSLTFAVFFACVLVLHNLPLGWTTKKINLLIASYLFYAAWNPPFVVLLWISTAVDWWAAKKLVNAENPHARRAWMLLSVVVNLGMLGYFKYGGFLMENFAALMQSLGVVYQPPGLDIVLPVGISFYTFATLSYTLDVYLRRSKPANDFLDYALFVTFFPHLVAGPIMRPTELVPQFEHPHRATAAQLRFGLALMVLGLFQKIVLADGFLAPAAEAVYDAPPGTLPGALDAWMGTLAFSGQIFCDFAGYSTTAIGAAMCLGFAMPDNFRFPYAAVGFSDFWRRWHITLSAWLRDYLYIPLGGNRHGSARTYFALMATMLLGGLWHGASWTFVVWGGLHGLYLAVERTLRSRFAGYVPGPLALFGLGLLTYALVNITWVFFRSRGFGQAWSVLQGMFGGNAEAGPILSTAHLTMVALIVAGIVAAHWLMRARTLEAMLADRHPVPLSAALGVMAFAIVAAQGAGNAFIYFQF